MKSNAGTVSAYLSELPADRRRALETLREMIEKAAPQAKPTMKYGLPTWEWNGPLFALAARPHGLELYVAEADVLLQRKKSLGDVEVGTASVRFKRIEDLKLEIVAIVLADAADRRKRGPTPPRP
jgi:uncharacterized protein YdhG (YjbR/CyaY superfamily)